jgi:hypothetical protein
MFVVHFKPETRIRKSTQKVRGVSKRSRIEEIFQKKPIDDETKKKGFHNHICI